MPKLFTLSTDNVCTAENQQETRKVDNFYISGFCAGEMSCSVIKQSRPYGSGFSYSPDLTISNEDHILLAKVNACLCDNRGVISSIHGGYNLSMRGKKKVALALSFFSQYPIIAGDIANAKMLLLKQAMNVLSAKGKSTRRNMSEIEEIEHIRANLKLLKKEGLSVTQMTFHERRYSRQELGYFLCGIFDAEGSIGLKRCDKWYQLYFAVGMKDREIIELFQFFLGFGNICERKDEKLYLFETAKRSNVVRLLKEFFQEFPSKLEKNIIKIHRLNRILNDYTRNGKDLPIYYNDGHLW